MRKAILKPISEKTGKKIATVKEVPDANPSSPSVRFTALVIATTINTMYGKIHHPIFTAFQTNGIIM
jgi:hypothetical protein